MSAYLLKGKEITFKQTKSESNISGISSTVSSQDGKSGELVVKIEADNVHPYVEDKLSSNFGVFTSLKTLLEDVTAKKSENTVKLTFDNAPVVFMVSQLKVKLEGEFLLDVRNALGQDAYLKLEICSAKTNKPNLPNPGQPKNAGSVGGGMSLGSIGSESTPTFGTGVFTSTPVFGTGKALFASTPTFGTVGTFGTGGAFGSTATFGTGASTNTGISFGAPTTQISSTSGSSFGAPTATPATQSFSFGGTKAKEPVPFKGDDTLSKSTAAMPLLRKKDSSLMCCEGIMTLPKDWSLHWKDGDQEIEYVATINLIVSVADPFSFRDSSNVTNDIYHLTKRLLQEQIRTDMEILTGNGKAIKCHSAFLVSQSEVLKSMVESEKQEAIKVPISDVSEEGLKNFLGYLYFRDLENPKKDSNAAVELLQAGHRYMVQGLQDDMSKLLLDKPVSWYSADAAIRLFKFSKSSMTHAGLKSKAVQVLKSKSGSVMACQEYKRLFETGHVEGVSSSGNKTNVHDECAHGEQLQLVKELCNALLVSDRTTEIGNAEVEEVPPSRQLPCKEE